jgi:hypothetical protein
VDVLGVVLVTVTLVNWQWNFLPTLLTEPHCTLFPCRKVWSPAMYQITSIQNSNQYLNTVADPVELLCSHLNGSCYWFIILNCIATTGSDSCIQLYLYMIFESDSAFKYHTSASSVCALCHDNGHFQILEFIIHFQWDWIRSLNSILLLLVCIHNSLKYL